MCYHNQTHDIPAKACKDGKWKAVTVEPTPNTSSGCYRQADAEETRNGGRNHDHCNHAAGKAQDDAIVSLRSS